MTAADEAILDLDRALIQDEAGEVVTLQRLTLGPGGVQIPFGVDVWASIRGYRPDEIVAGSGITQKDVKVIMSPTEINRSGWPGAAAAPAGTDKRLPRHGDRILTGRGTLAVQGDAAGIFMGATLVRIECQARGTG